MAGTKLIEKGTIEAVSNKPNPKFKQAGGLKINGEWVNVAMGQDLSIVHKGDTIDYEVYVSENGKRKIDKILGLASADAVSAVNTNKEVLAQFNTVVQSEEQIKQSTVPKVNARTGYIDNSRGQMLGGIFHDAVGLTAITSEGLTRVEVMAEFDFYVDSLLKVRERLK